MASRPRVTVVSGSRSGMGKALCELLEGRGERVVGVDLRDAQVAADLGAPEGRAAAVEAIRKACPDGVDAVVACAGLAIPDGPAMIAVNYFGAVALLEGLLPQLVARPTPRAVVISSSASILPFDEELVELCLAGDEARALDRAADRADAYASSKRAVSRWIRRTAPRPEWAGAGVLLNGVAPGIVRTPMTAGILATEEGRAQLALAAPYAVREAAGPEHIAPLLAFLASADNRYMVGQTPFCDGGADVLLRGDAVI
ncbi:MAG: SDR family oxidoreductase [Caulobacteraceae bacterium]|nr:SDR family oxidoreductase [Caulobacteraceae bacterium]